VCWEFLRFHRIRFVDPKLMFIFDQFSAHTPLINSFLLPFDTVFLLLQSLPLQDEEFRQEGQGQGGYDVDCSNSDEEETFFPKNSSKERSRSCVRNQQRRTDSHRSSSSKPKKASRRPPDYDSDTSKPSVLSKKASQHRQIRRVLASQEEMVNTRNKTQEHRDAEKKIKELQAQLAEMEKQKQVVEKESQDQQRQVDPDKRASKKSKHSIYVAKKPISKDLEAQIPEVAGPKGPNLWRTTKFLNGKEDLIKATAQVMRDIPDCKKYLEEPDVNVRSKNTLAFKETYGQLMTGEILPNQALNRPTLSGTPGNCPC
jgi:chromosome segregation ATPase